MIEEASTVDGESAIPLEGLAAGVDQLEAVVVFMLSHLYTYASWVRPSASLSAAAIATSLRDAYLASAHASARLRAGSSNGEPPASGFSTLTLEDPARITIVQRVRAFAVATIFERDVPLGLARAHAHKIARTLEHELPYEPAMRPPSSESAVTVMKAPRVVSPVPTAQPADDAVRAEVEEPAPITSQSVRRPTQPPVEAAPATRVDRPEPTPPPPIPRPPESTTGERLGLRRPSPAAPAAPVRPAPVPALAIHSASEDSLAFGAEGSARASAPAPDVADASPEARAIRLVAYVERTSIEPHISLLRLALRSGLGVDELRELKRVTPEQLVLLEAAAEDMLGVDRGKLTERIRNAAVVLPLPQPAKKDVGAGGAA